MANLKTTVKDTLVNALMYHCTDLSTINGEIRPGIVHRIDKDTSGLLVACKNDYAHNHIAKQLKEKSSTRIYLAIVYGNFDNCNNTHEQCFDVVFCHTELLRLKLNIRLTGMLLYVLQTVTLIMQSTVVTPRSGPRKTEIIGTTLKVSPLRGNMI